MKFRPRFSIRTLAIVVTVVAFSVWWVTWPKRTAETFFQLLIEGKSEEVSQYMMTEQDREMAVRIAQSMKGEMVLDTERIRTGRPPVGHLDLRLQRSWSDMLLGRATIQTIGTPIYVRRGRVTWDLEAKAKAFFLERELRQKSKNPAMSNEKSGP
jgi:hypothetical protein